MQGPTKTVRMGAGGGISIRPPPNVKPGTVIGDKYRVEKEIGRGGFGVVVRAIHLTLDQRVAIKVLTEGEGSSDVEFAEDAARFRREAKATAALRNDHVVRIIDADVLPSGYPYIVMEHLEGRTLHDVIYTAEAPMPVDEVVDMGLQVLAALAEAHSVGIVHRDLKPANVFLTKGLDGGTLAKVLDFGVSKMLGASSQRLTRTGAVVGTVAYMSPEQMLDAKRVDGRADLWSLGLILYEALAGRHPFGATSGPQVVTAILNEPLPPLRVARPDIPAALDAIITRMLDKKSERRFLTALDLANALAPLSPARSRPTLDEIRRTPPAAGAAAPEPASKRSKDRPSAPAPPLSSKRGRSSRAGRPAKKRSLAGNLLRALVSAMFVGAIAFGLIHYRARLLPLLQRVAGLVKTEEPPPVTAAPETTPPTPSAVVPSAAPLVSAAPSTSAALAVSATAAPSASVSAAPTTSTPPPKRPRR